MNFEDIIQNNRVIDSLQNEVDNLKRQVQELISQQTLVRLGVDTQIVSNPVSFVTSVDQGDITIDFNYSHSLTGTEYDIVSVATKLFGNDKYGNRNIISESNKYASNFTLKPSNFPAKAVVDLRVKKDLKMYLLTGAADLSNINGDVITIKLKNNPSENEQEMTIQEAIQYLYSKI